MKPVATASTASSSSVEAARNLVAALEGAAPRVIVFFAGIDHDGRVLGEALSARFPEAHVVGCSTNGEFGDRGYSKGGAVAIAIGAEKVARAVSALGRIGNGVDAGVAAATSALSAGIGASLRELDPTRYVGIALLEGARGAEERINELLGNAAPQLSFVGGSAGDNIAFKRTWAVRAFGGACEAHDDACAFLVLEMKVPFAILKTSSATSTGRQLRITRADPARRLVHELDGKPAAPYYASLLGTTPDKLGFEQFLSRPLGLMLDGEPWLRSIVGVQGDALFFSCAMNEGMTVDLMQGGDLVASTAAGIEKARQALGAPIGAALMWNCAYRMIEAQVGGVEGRYHELLSAFPHAGMHSNGECWMAHLNDSLTGLLVA